MAIQMVGRARGRGLALTPTQVFQAPTPRGLAQLAVPVGVMAGRDAVDDAVPLTPIQHWFMETPMLDRHRGRLSVVFALPFLPPLDRLRAFPHALPPLPATLSICCVAGQTAKAP